MAKGHEVIFADESSSHLWERRQKFWMLRDEPMKLLLPGERGPSVKIIAGISSKRKGLSFKLSLDSTTS